MTRSLPKRDLRIGPKAQEFLESVNATGDPGRDNARVLEWLAAEDDPARVPGLQKDDRRIPLGSSWEAPYLAEDAFMQQIRLCYWHYLETGNPLFVFRAIDFSQHLTARNAHHGGEWALN
jgi:hypothetical protein